MARLKKGCEVEDLLALKGPLSKDTCLDTFQKAIAF